MKKKCSLKGLKDILLQEDQSYTEFESFCKMVQSSKFEIPWYNLVSSAKLTMLEENMRRLISPIRIIKRMGPRQYPAGHHYAQDCQG